MSGPFKMKGFGGFGNSPLHQKKPPKDLVDAFSLIPGSEYVKKTAGKIKKKIHKSKFAQKHLIVDPNKEAKLSKVGEFVKRHIE